MTVFSLELLDRKHTIAHTSKLPGTNKTKQITVLPVYSTISNLLE